MRNAVKIDDETFVVIDNSGCIGELADDAVHVPNEVAAYYSTRVALFELWCAGAEPTNILLANFTGDGAWEQYVKGIKQLFEELQIPCPIIAGSTETNFQMKQSAFSITMIGRKKWEPKHDVKRMHYYVVGEPLVGDQLVSNPQLAVDPLQLYNAIQQGVVKAMWSTGSKGIFAEIERFIGSGHAACNGIQSAGPSTAVLVAVEDEIAVHRLFTAPVTKIHLRKGEN